MKHKISAIILFLTLASPLLIKAQFSLYIGEGIGSYLHYSGALSSRAFVFNKHGDVSKEMQPDLLFSGMTLGANVNFKLLSVGIDYAYKYNIFSGKRETPSYTITDKITQSLNTFYINFGIGNNCDRSSEDKKKIVWRVQTSLGIYNFQLNEDLVSPTGNFNGVLGKTAGMSWRNGVSIWIPFYKKLQLGIMPYYEFDIADGYVEILENTTQNSEYFNITHCGLNLNLNYAF